MKGSHCVSLGAPGRSRQGANRRVRAAWHAEPRYNAVATFDADLVDECPEDRLARWHGAAGDGLLDVLSHLVDHLGVGCGGRRLLNGDDQLFTPLAEVAHLGGEPLQTLGALGFGQRPGLERREVALDGVFGLGDPRLDDGLVEEVGALVGAEERVEDLRVQRFCRQALGW